MNNLESRLNFTSVEHAAPESAICLKDGQPERYYQDALNAYCSEHGIDQCDDCCSAMIMSDYCSEDDLFWFWID